MEDVEKLVCKDNDRVTDSVWVSYVAYAGNLQERDYSKDVRCDQISEPVATDLYGSDADQTETANSKALRYLYCVNRFVIFHCFNQLYNIVFIMIKCMCCFCIE